MQGGLRTVTGAVTVTTFPSSINSSLALWHSSRTCASGIGRHARNCAIALEIPTSASRPAMWSLRDALTCQGRSFLSVAAVGLKTAGNVTSYVYAEHLNGLDGRSRVR